MGEMPPRAVLQEATSCMNLDGRERGEKREENEPASRQPTQADAFTSARGSKQTQPPAAGAQLRMQPVSQLGYYP